MSLAGILIVACCALVRALVGIALTSRGRSGEAQRKLDAIAALEVHGREFIDATQLYRILGKPIPAPIDHAANIRARLNAGQELRRTRDAARPKYATRPPLMTTPGKTPPPPDTTKDQPE